MNARQAIRDELIARRNELRAAEAKLKEVLAEARRTPVFSRLHDLEEMANAQGLSIERLRGATLCLEHLLGKLGEAEAEPPDACA